MGTFVELYNVTGELNKHTLNFYFFFRSERSWHSAALNGLNVRRKFRLLYINSVVTDYMYLKKP